MSTQYSLRAIQVYAAGVTRQGDVYAMEEYQDDGEIIAISGKLSHETEKMVHEKKVAPEVVARILVYQTNCSGKRLDWANKANWSPRLWVD